MYNVVSFESLRMSLRNGVEYPSLPDINQYGMRNGDSVFVRHWESIIQYESPSYNTIIVTICRYIYFRPFLPKVCGLFGWLAGWFESLKDEVDNQPTVLLLVVPQQSHRWIVHLPHNDNTLSLKQWRGIIYICKFNLIWFALKCEMWKSTMLNTTFSDIILSCIMYMVLHCQEQGLVETDDWWHYSPYNAPYTGVSC